MKAFISGEAGTAVIVGPRPTVRTIYGAIEAPWHAGDALRVFDGCYDVRAVEATSAADIDRQCELAWAEDRSLRLFLFLLDPEEPEEELAEYAECVADLIETHSILVSLKRRLASAQLPFFEADRVERACAAVGSVRDLFHWLIGMQPFIARIHAAFDGISFGEEIASLRQKLKDDGSFLKVATELAQGKDLAFLRLQIVSRHRAAAGTISRWLDGLQGNLKKLSRAEIHSQTADEEDEEYDPSESRQPNPSAYDNVRAQQRTIIAKIKEHDLPQARRLMEELVASQRFNSTREQVAKSLSNMAQQAKNHDIPELALEWSRAATIENPIDPITYGHLANALIELGVFDEAEAALDQVQAHGDPLFAQTGRARIMRAQGRVTEAREAFVAIAKANENVPGVFHAKLGGAEALRELGDVQGALQEYRQLSIFSPEEPGVWTGLASTLVDLGEIDEAMKTYSKAATRYSMIARVGQAQAWRAFGKLIDALALFDGVLLESPRNCFALCGRADVLQDQGKLDLALAAYEQAIELSPYRIEPILGKINVLRHMNRFEEAFAVHRECYDRFRYERRFVAAPIAIYRAQGRFNDSLVACDKLIAAFPFDMFGRTARASILGRLGVLDEAMAAYDAILAERPRYRWAMLGKASVLIRLGRNAEAEALLPSHPPRSRGEWRTITLKTFLLEDREGARAASQMLVRLIPECPFAIERRRLRDLLATIELRLGHWEIARRVVEAHPEEVSNVISLHVLAATHRTGRAQEWLTKIRSSDGPADVMNLADEIARRHRLTDEPPRNPPGWIEATERNILLAEAA